MSSIFDKWIPDKGKEISYKAYPVILLRLFAGVLMFFAGIEKLLHPIWSEGAWTSAGFLAGVTDNPFQGWFNSMSGNTTVDGLVVWGEILIGLALILGILVRFASYCGIVENGLFWLASYKAGTGPFGVGWRNGPLELNAALVAMYIIFILIGAGLIYGLDSYIQKTEIVKKNSWMKIFLG